jgi:cellulose synthase/poly-beta-1,6-N-acetylglucosamine synthase-like glycosyltransferase
MLTDQFIIACTNVTLVVCALGVLGLCLVLLVECMLALLPERFSNQPSNRDIRFATLVPAHNEEFAIHSTLSTLSPMMQASNRLIVIADNCTDATAEVARATGAEVIERQDNNRRGKGYALDYGLSYLEADPPDVVVFVDADCQVKQGAIDQITQLASATQRPVQAAYLMERPDHPTLKSAISTFAFKVKNLVRLLGLYNLGMPSLLTGTGMAFPWSVIRSVDLASDHIVEDMKLGLDLAIAGHPPIFCSQANVVGRLPQKQAAAKSQRTRWEHGHLQTLLTYVPVLLKSAIQQRRLDLLTLALDLCVPPLSLLVVLWLGISVIALSAAVLGLSWLPISLTAIAGLCLFTAILSAWAEFGRSDLPLTKLLMVPVYILWKIPLYFKFLIQPQRKWVRTERDVADAQTLN